VGVLGRRYRWLTLILEKDLERKRQSQKGNYLWNRQRQQSKMKLPMKNSELAEVSLRKETAQSGEGGFVK